MSEIVDLSHRYAVLEFSGEEALAFLHRQLTCRVEGMRPNQACVGAWLNPQGRVLAVVLVLVVDDGARVVLPRERVQELLPRFRMFILNARVEVEVGEWTVTGRWLTESTSIDLKCLSVTRIGDEQRVPWPGGREITLAPVRPSRSETSGDDRWSVADIDAMIPWVGNETSGRFVAQMLGLDQIGAIDFGKGCYPGQEIIARTRHLGRIKRRPRVLIASGDVPAGASLLADTDPEEACGEVLNSATDKQGNCHVLAVVRVEHMEKTAYRARWEDTEIELRPRS